MMKSALTVLETTYSRMVFVPLETQAVLSTISSQVIAFDASKATKSSTENANTKTLIVNPSPARATAKTVKDFTSWTH